MNLVKCPNGHFYDAARFGNKCPLCGMSGVESNGDQTTVPMSAGEAASVPPTVPRTTRVRCRRLPQSSDCP